MSFIRVNTTVRKYKVVVQGIKWRTTANGGTLYSVEEMEAALPGMFYEFILPQNHPDMESRTGSLLVLQNGTDGTDQIATVGNLIYLKETDGHFRVIQARNKYTVIEITDWNDIEFTGEGTYILKDVTAATHRPTVLEAPGDGVTKQYNCTLIGNDDSWTLLMFTGSKKYVWDFKSNTITEMASGTGGGGTGGTVTYTNPNKVPTTLGGIAANTTFNEKTMQEMWDALLYPESNPTVEDPTYSVSCTRNLVEVGSSIQVDLVNNFNPGVINPIYIYDEEAKEWKSGGSIRRVAEQVNGADTHTYSGHVNGEYPIAFGANTFERTVTFPRGRQPLTSKGNIHLAPYPNATDETGSFTRSVTITGVYPIYATTVNMDLTDVRNKQPLQSHGSAITLNMASEVGGFQTVKIPYSVTINGTTHTLWNITTLYLQDPSKNWVVAVMADNFDISEETINGVLYKVYTNKVHPVGIRPIKFN